MEDWAVLFIMTLFSMLMGGVWLERVIERWQMRSCACTIVCEVIGNVSPMINSMRRVPTRSTGTNTPPQPAPPVGPRADGPQNDNAPREDS